MKSFGEDEERKDVWRDLVGSKESLFSSGDAPFVRFAYLLTLAFQ